MSAKKDSEKEMRINFQKLYFVSLFIVFTFQISHAQSTNQNTPTPVISNEIAGSIPARAIGDPRLTNFYYAFNGNQGDVFVNIVTTNLDGDIDIFTIDGLRPLTKITLFSDNSESETGRVVYLRKSEKLLLRIQGRTPNDQAATFRIKFAGSFEALPLSAFQEVKLPEINTKNQGEMLVNSVGTIIGVVPKPTPEVKVKDASNDGKVVSVVGIVREKEINVKSVDEKTAVESSARIEIRRRPEEAVAGTIDAEKPEIVGESKPIAVIAEDSIAPGTKPQTEPLAEDQSKSVEDSADAKPQPNTTPTNLESDVEAIDLAAKTVQPMNQEQLQKIQLVVKFKDGTVYMQPMSKIFSFNVNQGVLTIITNDGKSKRYSLLDVEKISIE